MKTRNLLLILPLIALASCGGDHQDKNPKELLIDSMRGSSFRVSFEGTRSMSYPEGYESYDYEEKVTYYRDYGLTSSNERSVRVISGDDMYTYFESSDGGIYTEFIDPSNQVKKSPVTNYGMALKFSNVFRDPFEFIDENDIGDNLLIDSDVAYLIFNSFTGDSQPIDSATFTVDEKGMPKELSFEFVPLPIGISASGGVLTAYSSLKGTMTFNFDIPSFTHLSAYSEKSGAFEAAINNLGNNYTIYTDSNALSVPFVTYVTENAILIHLSGNTVGAVAGDLLYTKNGSSYRAYHYSGKAWMRDESVAADEILPDLSSISANIIGERESNHLYVKDEAVAYGTEKFLLPYTSLTSGTGMGAEIYLKNNHIDYVNMTFAYYSGNIVMKNAYDNYGTTSMPLWLEMPK